MSSVKRMHLIMLWTSLLFVCQRQASWPGSLERWAVGSHLWSQLCLERWRSSLEKSFGTGDSARIGHGPYERNMFLPGSRHEVTCKNCLPTWHMPWTLPEKQCNHPPAMLQLITVSWYKSYFMWIKRISPCWDIFVWSNPAQSHSWQKTHKWIGMTESWYLVSVKQIQCMLTLSLWEELVYAV